MRVFTIRVLLIASALTLIAVCLNMGCSPVQFSQGTTNCSVSSPCVNGLGSSTVQQTFNFNATNQVDILIIDDNSGSMTTEQENLATPFNNFISNLNTTHLDWQIGITNTDVCGNSLDASGGDVPTGYCPGPSGIAGADGAFMNPLNSDSIYGSNIITPSTPSAASVFYSTIQRQNQLGSGDERAIFASNLAIDGASSITSGFFRDNSNLAIVILSDEDERSVGGTCQEIDPADPTQYENDGSNCDAGYASLENYDLPTTLIGKVQSTWGGSKNLIVYSIIIPPEDQTLYPDPNLGDRTQTCLELQSHQPPVYTAHPGTFYQSLSQQTGGMVGSICDNGAGAFSSMLSQITGDLQNQQTSNVITLAYVPSATPVVTFTPPGNAVPWTLSNNQITFSTRPANGTTVQVSYTFSSSAQGNFWVPVRGASPLTMKALPLHF